MFGIETNFSINSSENKCYQCDVAIPYPKKICYSCYNRIFFEYMRLN